MQKTVRPIRTGEEYIESLKGRNLKVYLFGELVKEPVDHPIIRPSINAVAKLMISLLKKKILHQQNHLLQENG